jgi:SAM-dependent methyltransferase
MTDELPVATPRDHFSNLVPQWSDFGPPLRPSPDDIAAMQRAISRLEPKSRAVILGLTPEIVACTWPPGVDLLAFDHSPAMIRKLWPQAASPPNARVQLADWCAMPVPSHTIDLVAGDGCFICLLYPDGFAALVCEVCRVLTETGRFAIRVFLRPDQPESVDDIARALADGKIGSVHALKLRLHAALHGASGVGTRLDDVWRTWRTMPPLPASLAGSRGWSAAEIVGIESYRDLQARYFLPTLAEFRSLLSPALVEIECSWGRYELADRCPTLIFSRGA